MKQLRRLLIILVVSLIPCLYGGIAAAETLSVTQQITVTAVVPGHRDIVIDAKGRIVRITSNTLEDITPTVYLSNIADENKQVLTPALLTEYRRLVPEGTEKYGTIYESKQPFRLVMITSPVGSINSKGDV